MKQKHSLAAGLLLTGLLLNGCGSMTPTATPVQPTATTLPAATDMTQAPATSTMQAPATNIAQPAPTSTMQDATPTIAQVVTPTMSDDSTATTVTGATMVTTATTAAGATTATGGTTPLASSAAHDKVRFALDWTPNTNHTGIYVALQKGWYAEQGIDLQILPYSDANTPDTLVATGQADFGISFEESVVTDRVSKLPIKSVAAVLQTNTSALASLKSSGLDRPARLEGKRYAGFGSTFEEPVVATVLKSDGAPTGKIQNITTNLSGYQAIIAKQADFLWIYQGWEGVQAKLDRVDLNVFPIKNYGVPDYYTPVIISNEGFLGQHGDVARRFLAATARGYEYGVTNPDNAADILVKSAPASTFADPTLPHESQKYLAPYYKGDQQRWGQQKLEYWTNFPRFIANTGLLKTPDGKVVKPEEIDYSSLFTNDYLPQK
ncbi:MAG: ABC transporter substrate-binding protein [Chloroflexota bacterium]|nr:ABC transporter substrate-binding protein [Chloroflexota bacterium]